MSSLFVIALLVFAAGALLVLVARLVRSYPVVFLALVALLGSTVLAIVDGNIALGVCWGVLAITSTVA